MTPEISPIVAVDAADPIDVRNLLAELPFVRGLARELLRDPAAAEDVAQEVAIAALGAREGPRGPTLRPWLVGVTRRLALGFFRGERRRVQRDRNAARGEALPPTSDEALRFEALRRVVAALERLDERDRSLLLRRFYDGWPPRRIAAELGIPVNTVRTRLQRALERLRGELVRASARSEHGPRLRELLLLLAPAPIVKFELVAAAAVMVLVLTGAGAWRASHSAPDDVVGVPSRELPIAAPPSSATATSSQRVVVQPPAVATAPAPTSHALACVRLHGRLRGAPSLLSQWSTPLFVLPAVDVREFGRWSAHPAPERFELRVAVAADGTFAADVPIDGAAPRITRLLLRGDDPAFAPFERRFTLPWTAATDDAGGIDWEIDVPLFVANLVTGCVVDESGAPRAGVAVDAFARSTIYTVMPRLGTTRTVADGGFSLRVERPGPAVVLARDRGPPASAPIDVRARASVDVGDLVLRAGTRLSGRVDWIGRGAAAGATVLADFQTETAHSKEPQPVELDGGLELDAVDLEPRRARTVTDGEGRFAFEALRPGRWRLRVVDTQEGGVSPDLAESTGVTVDAPSDGTRLELRGGLVDFEVRADGRPLANALVITMSDGGCTRAHRGADYWTPSDGTTAVVLPPLATARWDCDAAGFRQGRGDFTAPVSGARALVPIELEPVAGVPSVVLILRGPRGESVGRAGFQVQRPEQRDHRDLDLVADAGDAFTLRDLEPGTWIVRGRPGGAFHAGEGGYREFELRVDVPADDAAAAGPLVRTIAIEPAGRLNVLAHDESGKLLAARFELRDAQGAKVAVELAHRVEDALGRLEYVEPCDVLSPDGGCHVDPALPAGRYVATFTLDGYEDLVLPVTIETGRCVELDVVLVARPGAPPPDR